MSGYCELLADALKSKFVAEGVEELVAATAADLVAAQAKLDTEGRNVVPVSTLIEAVRAEHPALFRPVTKPAETTTSDTRTPLQRDTDAARARAAVDRQNRVAELTTQGNPFSRAGWNITRQSILRNLDPALASRLQSEART